MRKLFIIAFGVTLMAFPLVANSAGISGSDHDLTTGYTLPSGDGDTTAISDDINICTSCHLPHNAVGDGSGGKLWAQDAASSQVGDLCESCHDGTVAKLQITTGSLPFVNTVHKNTANLTTCSGTSESCHDVHNQNPELTGKFLQTDAPTTGQCAGCHNDGFAPKTLKDNYSTGGTIANHPQGKIGCGDCHVLKLVHGTVSATAVAQTDEDETTDGDWLLPYDNSATVTGAVCVACHEDQSAPYANVISDVSPVYPDNDFKHSATADTWPGRHTTDGGSTRHTANDLTGCMDCHFVHTKGYTNGISGAKMLQKIDNVDSDACQTCHSIAETTAPMFGSNSHPVDKVFGPDVSVISGNFPKADEIDDAPYGDGDDYGGTTGWIVCETCHSVHRLGTVEANNPFLRESNIADAVCTRCHPN